LRSNKEVTEVTSAPANNRFCERALGELWKERPKNPGTRTLGGSLDGISGSALLEPPENTPTLAELGLDKKRAARNLCFADVELAKFDEIIADRRAR
jgi:hypothetical protein